MGKVTRRATLGLMGAAAASALTREAQATGQRKFEGHDGMTLAEFQELNSFDEEKIGQLIRDFGDDKYYNFGDIPFFYFRLTVMFNPDVVESWTFPGTSGSKTSHWDLIKAAQ